MKTKHIATGFAILAAALYAINVPFSKLLMLHVGPTRMAAFLYLGAGLGLLLSGPLGLGLHGYWWGSALAGFVSTIGGWAYFFSGRWKTRKILA